MAAPIHTLSFGAKIIGLLRRLRDSARIVETAHVVVSEIYTDGSGKQQKAQGHSLASMKKRNLKFG